MEGAHEEDARTTPEGEKVAILRPHLLEQEPVSKLSDELGLQPTVFWLGITASKLYHWRARF